MLPDIVIVLLRGEGWDWFGMWSIIPYFLYLLSLWYFTGMMRLPLALGGAVLCWSLSAWVLIFCWSRFH